MHLILIGALGALALVCVSQMIFGMGYKRGYADGYKAREQEEHTERTR